MIQPQSDEEGKMAILKRRREDNNFLRELAKYSPMLSTRAKRVILNSDVTSVEDIIERGQGYLFRQRTCGQKTTAQI